MGKKTQHVIPSPSGGWSVKRGGAEKASRNFDDKEKAIHYARKVSKNQSAELVIHRKDGTIANKDSHGNDPCPPKDKK